MKKRKSAKKACLCLILTLCLSVSAMWNMEPVNAEGTGLTEEERQESTYNPVYMGSDTDYKGNKLVIGEGPNGQIANQAELDYQSKYAEGKVYKVTDRVYVANGFGLANSAMIIGDTGITIVDTNDCTEASQKEYDAFREITDLPVKNIIFSHYHYTFGTQTYFNDEKNKDIKVYAHENHAESLGSAFSEISTTILRRNSIQQSGFLAYEGEDGAVGCGLGPFMTDPALEHHTSGYVAPTELISGEGITETEIDGVKITFLPAEADSKDNMTIWLPDEKVCINNLVWPAFPNIYTLRGDTYRDPRIWMNGIDQILELKPEHMVAVHGLPFSGTEEQIQEEVKLYRDGIQYVLDQTIRYMNKGYTEDEVVQAVKVPAKFTSGRQSGEWYGEVESHIRGIYHGLLGWFDGRVETLNPVSDEYEAKKLIEGFGGKEKVIADSKAALEDKQYSWAAQLITYVLTVDPKNDDAVEIKTESLRQMARATTSANARNFYLTQMAEMQGTANQQESNTMTKDKLMGAPRDTLLKMLSVSINPAKAKDLNMTVKFVFPDEDNSLGLQLENGVGLIIDEPQETDVTITVDYERLCELLCGEGSPVKALFNGDIKIDGKLKLIKFIRILDM